METHIPEEASDRKVKNEGSLGHFSLCMASGGLSPNKKPTYTLAHTQKGKIWLFQAIWPAIAPD